MIRRVIDWLAHPRAVFYLLPALMALLVFGTLAQRDIGLYEAERLYFASWFFWLGPLPLPGMYLLLLVLSLALLAKTLLKSPWHPKRAGIYITHLGALLLMAGGLLTAIDSEEGYVDLRVGESKRVLSDYHKRELVVLKDDVPQLALPHHHLHDGMVIEGLPFDLRIENYCRNCTPMQQQDAQEMVHGVAAKFTLTDGALAKEDEENQAGAMLRVTGADEADGIYATFEPIPHPPSMVFDGAQYVFQMRRQQRELPFSVALNSVERFTHPGTDTPREYQSDVTVTSADGLQRQQLIRMNEPLRIDGHTLYQASFVDARGEPVSVLAVVENRGRIFPYLAGVVMSIGLFWHAMIRMRRHG